MKVKSIYAFSAKSVIATNGKDVAANRKNSNYDIDDFSKRGDEPRFYSGIKREKTMFWNLRNGNLLDTLLATLKVK